MQASILSACNTSPTLIPPNQFEKILTFMPGLASAEETFRNRGNDMPQFNLPPEQPETISTEVDTASTSLEDILSLAEFIRNIHTILPQNIERSSRYELLSQFSRILMSFEDYVSLPAQRAIAALSVDESLLYADGAAPFRMRPLSLCILNSPLRGYLPDDTGSLLSFPTPFREKNNERAWRYTMERGTAYLNTLAWLLPELSSRGEMTEDAPTYTPGFPYPIKKTDSLLLAAAMVVRPASFTDSLPRIEVGKRHILAQKRFLRRLRIYNTSFLPTLWDYMQSAHSPCLTLLKQLSHPALPPTDYPVYLGFTPVSAPLVQTCSAPGIWSYALGLEGLVKLLACMGTQRHVLYGAPAQQKHNSHLVDMDSSGESQNVAWPDVPGMKRIKASTPIPGIPTVILCAETYSGTATLQIPVLPGRNMYGLPVALVPATNEAQNALVRRYGLKRPGRLAVLHHTLQDLADPSGQLFGKAFQQAFPSCIYTGVTNLDFYISGHEPADAESGEQRLKNLKSPDMAFHEFLVF